MGALPIAGYDYLPLPTMIFSPPKDGELVPRIIGFYNQMKQMYVSARYLFYEGLTADTPHFSDKGVLLYDTLTYPSYSLATEQIKFAFRSAYSILDQVGFFINDY